MASPVLRPPKRSSLREQLTLPAVGLGLAGLAVGLGLGGLLLVALGVSVALPILAPSDALGAPGLTPLAPLSLLSLNVRLRTSSGEDSARATVDGQWATAEGWRPVTPTVELPQWLALDLGAGPSRVFVLWNAGANASYNATGAGGLGAYTLETSADARTGLDGTWTRVVTVTENTVRTRGHSIPFTGQRWLRLTVTGLAPGATEAALDELAVYDVSAGLGDSWIFLGDGITARAFDRAAAHSPGFADLVQQAAPDTAPITLDAGIVGATSADGLAQLGTLLALNPDFHYWVLAYGSEDATADPGGAQAGAFARRMGALAAQIVAAGHVPVLVPIPYSRDPARAAIPQYNAALARQAAQDRLLLGPDLYAYFADHPDQLGPDGTAPTDAGLLAINRLWTTWRLGR